MTTNQKKVGWPGMIAMAVVCFGVYLLMRKYAFGDELRTNDFIIGGAISLGLMIGQLIRNRRNS